MKLFDLLLGKTIDRRIAMYQNNLIMKHYDEINNIYRQIRGWRHDYHSHVQTLLALIDNPDEIRAYLIELNTDLTTIDTILKTGNVMVDAILNSKLSLIKTKDINVNVKALVPSELRISNIDLCVIVGNLLDNAMEACLNLPDKSKRFIRIYIDVYKKQLYINVTNSVNGNIKKYGGTYLSTKNAENHGFGLLRVDHIAEKNGGYVNRKDEEGVFATEVMLPL